MAWLSEKRFCTCNQSVDYGFFYEMTQAEFLHEFESLPPGRVDRRRQNILCCVRSFVMAYDERVQREQRHLGYKVFMFLFVLFVRLFFFVMELNVTN